MQSSGGLRHAHDQRGGAVANATLRHHSLLNFTNTGTPELTCQPQDKYPHLQQWDT